MNGEVAEIRRRLSVFSERPMAVIDPETRALRRHRIVRRIAELLEQSRPQGRTWPGTGWLAGAGALGLAAGAALVVGAINRMERAGQASESPLRSATFRGDVLCQTEQGDSWTRCGARALLPGGRLKTRAEAEAELVTQAGVVLRVAPDSSLELGRMAGTPLGCTVTLNQGRLTVRVPPLPPGSEFVVVTPDAAVSVHGTAFVVEVLRSGRGEARSCVQVSEGQVLVRHSSGQAWVSAGRSWGCTQVAQGPEAADLSERASSEHPPPGAASTTASGAVAPRAGSSLVLETRLLEEGLRAERQGDLPAAERAFTLLLGRYPRSVVAPEARAALERIRAGRGRPHP